MKWSKSILCGIVVGVIMALVVIMFRQGVQRLINPVRETEPLILEKYSFPALRATTFSPGKIIIGDAVKKDSLVRTRTFYFFDGEKKVSGLLYAPLTSGTYPVIIMFRGYVDKEIYQPGVGTQRAAAYFAKNGFIVLAPDFLGYGSSDAASNDSLEARFQTYTTGLSLLTSVQNINNVLPNVGKALIADIEKIAIWGHSNGGSVALAVLEISGKAYPVSMWAPVTAPFPESILHFVDEMDDKGAYLRGVVADFVQNYNPRLYSPPQYIAWLNAPVLLHQGSADESVPVSWSDEFAAALKKNNKKYTYNLYQGDDHNFAQGSWITVVRQDVEFFRTYFKKEK